MGRNHKSVNCIYIYIFFLCLTILLIYINISKAIYVLPAHICDLLKYIFFACGPEIAFVVSTHMVSQVNILEFPLTTMEY